MTEFKKEKPQEGQCVVWIWEEAGLLFAGDYYEGKVRLAHLNYSENSGIAPSHWIDAKEAGKRLGSL